MPKNSGKNLPSTVEIADDNQDGGNNLSVHVETLNYKANDIAELRKLADSHPELARQVVRDREAQSIRENGSFRLGMIITGMVAVSIVGIGGWAVVQLGWFQAMMAVAALLATSHVLRVVLKGEWSDTSWLGALLSKKDTPDDSSH